MKLGHRLGLSIGLSTGVPAGGGGGGPSWPPTISTATLLYDFRTDAGVSSSGGNLTSWTDQVGGLVTSTHSGMSAPTVVSNQLNGSPCIRFDGTMGLTYGSTATAGGDLPQACTIMAVFKRQTGVTDFCALVQTYSSPSGDNVQGNLIYATTDTGVWGPFYGVVGTQKSSYTLSSYGVILLVVESASSQYLYTNDNASEHKTPAGATFAGTEKSIGSGGGFNLKGDLVHLAMFSGAANSTDAAAIIDAAQAKWGL